MIRLNAILLACIVVVAGCGTTPEERSVSGAGVGAAGGALLGAVSGLSVLEGAALGGLGGALVGALSDPNKLDLGEPLWKDRSRSHTHSHANARERRLVADIQAGLSQLGYDPGPVDGVMGPLTTRAIRRYQQDNDMPVDGRPTAILARRIQQDSGGDSK